MDFSVDGIINPDMMDLISKNITNRCVMTKSKRETRWGVLAIPQYRRKEFDQLVPTLNFEVVEQELSEVEEKLLRVMGAMLESFDFNRKTIKNAMNYGFYGDYSGFVSPGYVNFGAADKKIFDQCEFVDAIESLYYTNKLIDVFGADFDVEESLSIIAILNAVSARSVLDSYRLSGDEGHLSIQEIALLARMRETSVRNAAAPSGKTPLETQKHNGLTIVMAGEAERWLSERRGFQATTLPCDEQERRALANALENWVLTE